MIKINEEKKFFKKFKPIKIYNLDYWKWISLSDHLPITFEFD